MTAQIYQDENHIYQFDFSAATWASDQLHDIFHSNRVGILSDVDFIAETDDSLILVEYKNAKIEEAVHPEQFQPFDQKRENKIAYKFYDSWIYLTATQRHKPIIYVYVLEFPTGDAVMRKRLRNRIAELLPFKLQTLPEIKDELIRDFYVLSIEEWNAHECFRRFPIERISK